MTAPGVVDVGRIAEILGITERSARRMANRQSWPCEVINQRGDRRFVIDKLPADIRGKVMQAQESAYLKGMVLPFRGDMDLTQARTLLDKFDKAPAWSKKKAEARGEIVEAFEAYIQGRDKGLTDLKGEFIARYNLGNDGLGIPPEVYRVYEAISRASLDLWRSRKRLFGLAGLLEAEERGKPCGRITPEMASYIIGIKRERIHTRPARIYDYLANKFSTRDLPHAATVRRFIQKWEQDNAQLVSFLTNPDKWRSDFQAAFGDASVKAEYFLHMIEFDNTPADLLCSDGLRYTVTGAIDVFCRKAKCLVVPSSRSQAIANLMRRIILEWGLFDVMITDNGKDYASRHIEAACGALGIEPRFTAPFTPEAKPHIERFFRSISMMLFEELSGYIGHNVAERKGIESQRSFAQRMFQKDAVIECRMTAGELQEVIDTWIDKIYHQREHSGIGMSPEQKAGESREPVKRIIDERVLDILLAPVGRPTVSKKGIRYANGRYVAPELADYVKQKVQIRRDMGDAGVLYVFDMQTNFICIAKDASLEGLTVEEAVKAKKRQLKRVKEQARALLALAKEAGDPMGELLEAKRQASGQVMAFRRTEAFENNAVREAGKAVAGDEEGRIAIRPYQGGAYCEAQGKEEKIIPLREEPIFASRLERYQYLQNQLKIRTFTEREKGFIEGYEGSEEYFSIFVEPYQ